MANIAQPDLSVFGNLKTVNDFQRLNDEFALKKQLVALKASGGDLPAPLQLANEYQKRLAMGDQVGADMITQFAKIYDKGVLPPTYQPQPSLQQPATTVPLAPQKPITNQSVKETVIDLYGEGNNTGANNSPPPTMQQGLATTGGARVIPGYAGAAASISGAKKMADTQAQKDVELRMNPQIKKAETVASPIPEAAMNNIQEADQLVSTLGAVNADLGKIREGIGGNDVKLGPFENSKSRFKNWAAMSDPNSQNYATLKSTLEQQRNASLLLAKGVQTEGDAQRAWEQLMANLNDADNVAQRLEEIMAVNKRSAELQSKKANEGRANYGRPEKSFGENYTQPSSVTVAPTKSNALDIEFKLKKAGFDDAQIKEYKNARGLK